MLMPLVSNTGPFPEVFGFGRLTPFSRMHAANFSSAALPAALLKKRPRAPPAREVATPALLERFLELAARDAFGEETVARPFGPSPRRRDQGPGTAASRARGQRDALLLPGTP